MINHFLNKSLISLGLLFSFCAFTVTTYRIFNYYPNGYLYIIYILLIFLLLIGITYIFRESIRPIWFLTGLLLIAFVIRLLWVLNVETPIESDFGKLYYAAVSMVNGSHDFSSTSYFTTWVYQLGFTFYQATVLFVFKHSVFALKIFNILFSLGIISCIYFTGKELFNESVARIAAIIYAFYIPNILYCSVLTNQHLATFLFYLAFYFLVTKYRTSKIAWLYIGVLLALGNIIRPLAPVILIAIFIFLILQLLTKDEMIFKFKVTVISKNIVGIMLTFLIVGKVISAAFIAGGLTDYPLENRDPLWKFVLGFNHETNGQYSNSDADLITTLPLGVEREKASKELIAERIKDKSQLMQLFKNKFSIMWGGNDASVSWSMSGSKDERLFGVERLTLMNILTTIEWVYYSLILFFACIAFAFLLIEKQKDYTYSLYILLIIGYLLVHFLIEIQTRYRFFIMPAFVLFAGLGLVKAVEYFKKRTRKN